MPSERLIVEISEKGALVVKRNLADVGKGARTAESGVSLLKRALGLLVSAAIIRKIVQLADEFTNIQNRLKTVTQSEAELKTVTDELFAISERTRSSFEATAEVYARVALASRDLGISQKETLEFTESLNQAVILSGASASEAAAGLLQLSQGLASGTLRGDELRSVLEQLPVVADVIAKSMGITRGELRTMGEQGKISADIVLKAFREARGELSDQFTKAVPTVSQSFTLLRNSLTKLIGDLDSSTGATSELAKGIIWIAQNLDELKEPLLFVGDIAIATFQEMRLLFSEFEGSLESTGTTAQSVFQDIGLYMVALVRAAAQVVDKILGLFLGLFGAIVFGAQKVPGAIADLFFQAINGVIGIVESGVNKIIAGINKVREFAGFDPLEDIELGRVDNKFLGDARDLGMTVKDVFLEGFNQSALTDVVDGVINRVEAAVEKRKALAAMPAEDVDLGAKGQRRVKEEVDKGTEALNKYIASLRTENELLGLNNQARAVQEALIQARTKYGKDLSDAQKEEITNLVLSNQQLQLQRQLLDEITGPQEQYNQLVGALDQLLKDELISATEYDNKVRELKESLLGVVEDSGLSEAIGASMFDNASMALDEFISEGKVQFGEFARAVIADIARITAKLLLLKAFEALGIPGLPKFQHGGSFRVGGTGGPDSQVVAFRASPRENITITPPGQQPQQPQIAVNAEPRFTIVNDIDPRLTLEAMGTSAGGKVIMNHIRQNKGTYRKILGG